MRRNALMWTATSYEGKAVIHNKTAKTVFLRIPLWADKKAVQCRLNDKPVGAAWIGNYLIIPGLAPKDVITAKMKERQFS